MRCAGYYKGTTQYIGSNNLNKNTLDLNIKATTTLAMAAARIRAATKAGSYVNSFVDVVLADVDRIAAAYIARMKQNYAVSGQAVVSDVLLKSDALICKTLTEFVA